MKAFTWILIGISIIFLLCLPCLYQPTFENMDNADAVKIANEYVANLTKQRDSALKNAADTQVKVDEAKVRLANAQNVLDATTKQEDRTKQINQVQSITAEIAKYQKQIGDANVQLTNAKKSLDAMNKPEDKKRQTNLIQTMTTEIAKYQKQVDDAKVRLANAQKLLDATPKPEDRTKQINAVQSITAELARYQNSMLTYTKDVERFNALILDGQTAADNLKKQSAATPDQTPPASDATGVAFVAGPDNKMIELKPTGDLGGSPTYYQPGSYKFGSATYVPSYEDSVYLSKTTGQSSTSSYLDPATMKGGACSYYKNQPDKLEEMCLAIDKNNCGAMSCCVLLGGSKCVSGDALGPRNKLNYGDITVRDKDYYYHDGKCYGNCKP
jgi:hypothetical protein